MKILLDECIPWPMHRLLTITRSPASRLKVGAELEMATYCDELKAKFDLFITSDQNIRYQQNLAGRVIAILKLSTNDLRRIQAAASLIEAEIADMLPAEFKELVIP